MHLCMFGLKHNCCQCPSVVYTKCIFLQTRTHSGAQGPGELAPNIDTYHCLILLYTNAGILFTSLSINLLLWVM